MHILMKEQTMYGKEALPYISDDQRDIRRVPRYEDQPGAGLGAVYIDEADDVGAAVAALDEGEQASPPYHAAFAGQGAFGAIMGAVDTIIGSLPTDGDDSGPQTLRLVGFDRSGVFLTRALADACAERDEARTQVRLLRGDEGVKEIIRNTLAECVRPDAVGGATLHGVFCSGLAEVLFTRLTNAEHLYEEEN